MTARLPMFPLGSVVFPYTAVPLRVFEPRYQTLLDSVLETAGSFGIVLIERGFEVGGGDARFDVGSRVEVLDVQELEAGHRAVVVGGSSRLRVSRWLEDDPHPWAEVEDWPDDQRGSPDLEAGRLALQRVLALASELGADVAGFETTLADDPTAASYQLAALSPLTSLDHQRLLEAPGPVERVDQTIEMLGEQAEVLEAQLGQG